MVQIRFPGITIPEVTITAGFLLDVWIVGSHLKIPPGDITLIPRVTLVDTFVLFDTDDIIRPVTAVVNLIPQAVWNLCKSTLDSWAEDFYARRGGERGQ